MEKYIRSYKKLEVYTVAKQLVLRVYALLQTFITDLIDREARLLSGIRSHRIRPHNP